MNLLLAFLLIASLLAVWLIPASRGAARRVDDLELALAQLMDCENQNAFLTVRPKFSPYKFIQYSRYTQSTGLQGLELAFPFARWSENFFPKVISKASVQGISYEVQDDIEPGLRFVFVRFGNSTSQAAKFGKGVLQDIFGFDEQYRFRVGIN